MKKVSFIASTLLTSTMLLTMTHSVEAHPANLVTKDNAKQIATEALSNSGGNPNLQRLGRTVDKGDYFEIISHNRLNEGIGMYKVHKNGEVEYKNGAYSDFNQLQDTRIHIESGIAKAAKTTSSSHHTQINSVDCARELNRYYVGTIASSEVPSSKSLKDTQTTQSSVKTLPSTGDDTQQHSIQLLASLLLVMGTSLLLKQKHHSHSYLSTEHF
ncbi:LPXTG-motif cell wall-anchored protein [Staphylococcus hominis]|uniref:LPXTG cell wall anchor domain-containing protein n=1 Tax=Staphylococcus TaxID=1279 RepID=UPI0008A6065A|nr:MULTISPECIES: LPXTG cell wall anchor domain-containing protein [Staphylococcus]MBB4832175.1 LPXTG-motif cell wall-anchored protein [Staphylococcus hominis]MCI2870442.1 LPXTG cell wall anchor domain-containing protein [Staphylococcus hominis]MCI2874710.1 LPXTG cell wall anchor domain-containing protein [Staphylococcus hominis]MCI2890423.1 LPXTG cell wall anchor domain-containing protein [Staphylococcus hominis]MDS3867126.1 LPXTG cell wall anchor domain-containing protein [Staphylococcus homi